MSAVLFAAMSCWKCLIVNRFRNSNLRLPRVLVTKSFFGFVRYECEESFTTLNVDIRNHQNLLDSMEQYVKGDLLEGANAYHCEKCNKKVRMELTFGRQPVLDCHTLSILYKEPER